MGGSVSDSVCIRGCVVRVRGCIEGGSECVGGRVREGGSEGL